MYVVSDGVWLYALMVCVCVCVCSQISVTESKKVLLQTLDPVGDVQEMMEISGNGLDVSLHVHVY